MMSSNQHSSVGRVSFSELCRRLPKHSCVAVLPPDRSSDPADLRGPPTKRSLHASAATEDEIYLFGGYDGQNRINDLYKFNFRSLSWSAIPPTGGQLPKPRDRHSAAVYDGKYYIFGGFDNTTVRIADFDEFTPSSGSWQRIRPSGGRPPSARHSHNAVVYNHSMYVFGGYDGTYRSDLVEYNFITREWTNVTASGSAPSGRYRASCVVHGPHMYVHGGHDGANNLNDIYAFSFDSRSWSRVEALGPLPPPRDSHSAVICDAGMVIYGGCSGAAALGDMHCFDFETRRWTRISYSQEPMLDDPIGEGLIAVGGLSLRTQSMAEPGFRFCHTAVIHGPCMIVFGGYDGIQRLNDTVVFKLCCDITEPKTAETSLVSDLKSLVMNDLLSDVVFVVDSVPFPAHRILCIRIPYFHNLLTGEMMESRVNEIQLYGVSADAMPAVLEFIYTDTVEELSSEIVLDVLQAADFFGIHRLKVICEIKLLQSIEVSTVTRLIVTAEAVGAPLLREGCLKYMVEHFDEISPSAAFEEMARANLDIVFLILRRRGR